MPSPAPRSRRLGWPVRLLATAAALELAVGVVATQVVDVSPQGPSPAATHATQRSRVVPVDDARARRTTAVRALLNARAAAVRGKDRAAFLATVDPRAPAFRALQVNLFDALRDVPIGTWTYDLNPDTEQPADSALDALHGKGWWAPDVTLQYALAGYDQEPVPSSQYLTFVQRGPRWYVAADADFKPIGQDSGRGLWDAGRVVVVRGTSSLVLGHPGSRTLLRRVAADVDAAVPRVTALWGKGWARRVVVLVPRSQAEVTSLLGDGGDLSQIAAVATAKLTDRQSALHPIGERVIVNPPNFNKLGAVGRRVVLTHEVTHVATRASTGPFEPTWLVEGIADYAGFKGLTLPPSITARELRDDLRKGKRVTTLPGDSDFSGASNGLPQSYEKAWLAVVLLVDRYGQAKMLAVYRAAGAAGSRAAEEAAFSSVLGTSTAAFEKEWAANLAAKLR